MTVTSSDRGGTAGHHLFASGMRRGIPPARVPAIQSHSLSMGETFTILDAIPREIPNNNLPCLPDARDQTMTLLSQDTAVEVAPSLGIIVPQQPPDGIRVERKSALPRHRSGSITSTRKLYTGTTRTNSCRTSTKPPSLRGGMTLQASRFPRGTLGMNRHWLVIVIVILIIGSEFSWAEEKLRIGWVYAMANAPVVIAQQKGFYDQVGLNVESRTFTNGPVLHQALAAGELDLAYIGSPPVYHGLARGLQSRILAKVNHGQAAVIVRKDSDIKKLQDLKGKKIASIKQGSGMDVLLRGYVLGEMAGLVPEEDVSIIPMSPGNMGPSLESGVVDAAFIWEPFTSQCVIKDSARILFDVNAAEPGYPWYIITAVPEILKHRRDAVFKALQAHRMAVDFLNSAPTAGNDIIARAFKLEDVEDDKGKRHAAADIVAMARQRLGWAWSLDDKDLAFIQRLMNWSKSLGYLKKPLTPDDLVDTRLVRLLSLESGDEALTDVLQ